jgi:hypothetical protein
MQRVNTLKRSLFRATKEGAMNKDLMRHNRPPATGLHPLVYLSLLGFTLWFVLAAWGFAVGDGYADYLLAIVSGFFLIAAAIPLALWRQWRNSGGADGSLEKSGSIREWLSGNFQTWQARLKGTDAAIMALLPFAAVAIGMTAFAIVLHVVEHGTHAS